MTEQQDKIRKEAISNLRSNRKTLNYLLMAAFDILANAAVNPSDEEKATTEELRSVVAKLYAKNAEIDAISDEEFLAEHARKIDESVCV